MKTEAKEQTGLPSQVSYRRAHPQLDRKLSMNNNDSPLKVEAQILPPKKVSSTAYIIYEIQNQQKVHSPSKISFQPGFRRKEYQGKIHAALNIKTAS